MKRILAMVCALSMIFTLVPKVALADEISYEAQIGDTKYETYAEAFAAVEDGETITLLKDVAVDGNSYNVKKAITLDLNGNTMSAGNSTAVAYVGTDKAFTVKNGTIKTDIQLGLWFNGNGNYTISNVTIEENTSFGGVYAQNGNVLIENSDIIGPYGNHTSVRALNSSRVVVDFNSTVKGMIFVYGSGTYGSEGCQTPTLEMYGKVYNENVQAISTNGLDMSAPVINVYESAEIIAKYTDSSLTNFAVGMYIPNCGSTTIYGGTIEGDSCGIGFKNGQLNILGGTIKGVGAYNIPSGFGNGIEPSGAAVQLESNNAYKNESGYNGISVKISGNANIVSENSYAVYEYTNNGDNTHLKELEIESAVLKSAKETIKVSEKYAADSKTTILGGNYSDNVAISDVAEGYSMHITTDGTYNVHNAIVAVEAKEPTNSENGNTSHYACPSCGTIFSDAEGTNIIDKSEVTIPALIQVEDSKATVSDESMNNAIDKATEEQNSVVVDLTEVGSGVEEAEISVDSLKAIEDAGLGLTLVTSAGSIELDSAAVESILEKISKNEEFKDATTVTLAIKDITSKADALLNDQQLAALDGVDVANIIRLEVLVDGKVVVSEDLGGFGDGKALVSIAFIAPEGEDGSEYSLYYIDENGEIVKVECEYVDGYFKAELSHFSTYFIAKADAFDGDVLPDNTKPGTTTPEDSNNKTESPKTGDTNALGMFMILFAVSGLSLAALVSRRKN